jgi:hypothetical protein
MKERERERESWGVVFPDRRSTLCFFSLAGRELWDDVRLSSEIL